MNFSIGQKVMLRNPYMVSEPWEIFCYTDGRYSIWSNTIRSSMEVDESEIMAL